MTQDARYSMVIEWSPKDQAFVVILPEWANRYAMPVTDGGTYEEAVARGRNVLENFIEFAREGSEPLPVPRVYAAA
jgi:antitoxin HicB